MALPVSNALVGRSDPESGATDRCVPVPASVPPVPASGIPVANLTSLAVPVRLSKGDGSILHFSSLAAAIPFLELDLRLI